MTFRFHESAAFSASFIASAHAAFSYRALAWLVLALIEISDSDGHATSVRLLRY